MSDTAPQQLSVCVVGAGAWGTALASVLIEGEHKVTLWAFEPEVAASINTHHTNPVYLPDVELDPRLVATTDLKEAVTGCQLIVSVVPAQHARRVTQQWAPFARPDAVVVNASKGIENGTHQLLSEVFDEVLPEPLRARIAFLSGPSFAKEVARGLPTVVVVAAKDEAIAEHVQHVFARPTFRTYRTTDVVGVEVGGALKNVMAIATGVSDGLGLGNNARAAIITRGCLELTRIAVKLGADPITMMGLAGIGDLVLTSTGEMSRNRTVGKALGAGKKLKDILENMAQVVEGVTTAKAAYELSQELGLSTPIVDEVYAVLYEDASCAKAVERLMTRELKREEV